MKLNLVENENDRQLVMKEENKPKLLEILRKLGNVTDYMTEHMVAEFYNVNQKGIEQIANRKSEELKKYGYKLYKRSEILNLQVVGLEDISNRGLRLYTIESIVVIGMMLTKSEVAEKLRNELIKDRYINK